MTATCGLKQHTFTVFTQGLTRLPSVPFEAQTPLPGQLVSETVHFHVVRGLRFLTFC